MSKAIIDEYLLIFNFKMLCIDYINLAWTGKYSARIKLLQA